MQHVFRKSVEIPILCSNYVLKKYCGFSFFLNIFVTFSCSF
eukprot:UN02650